MTTNEGDPGAAGETGVTAASHGPQASVGMEPLDERAPTPQLHLRRAAVLGFIGMFSVAAGAMLGGQSFETHLPGAWFFGMPGGHLGSWAANGAQPPAYALLAVYGGLILLCRVWWQLMVELRKHPGFPVKKIVLVALVWAVPLLVAPPLFSRDVYSYGAQGELVSHHISPYSNGTVELGFTPFSTLADEANWGTAITPYGPTFLGIDGMLDDVSGHQVLADLVLLRLLEIGGIALIVAATPTLARWMKRDPAQAVLLGAGSPLVLTMLVGGAHNEALMLGLLLAGLAAYKRYGPIPGIVLCALAAGVKSPALLGVVFIGWLWAGTGASTWRRIAHTAGAGVIALATLEIVSLITGLGWGWIGAATTSDKSFTGVTPVSALSRLVWVFGWLTHHSVSLMGVHTAFSAVGLAIAAFCGWRLLLRSPQEGLLRCLGLSLLVLALLGPVVWAWYVTWGVVVLAPVAADRLRKVVMVIVVYWTFIGVTAVKNVGATLIHTNVLADLIVISSAIAIAIVPLGLFQGRRPLRLPTPLGQGPRPKPDLLAA